MSTNLPITFYIQHSFIHLIHLFNLIIHFHSSFHFLFIKNYNLPFIHSLIHSLVYSLDHLFVHSLDHLFVHSFVRSQFSCLLNCSFIHSIRHSFNISLIYNNYFIIRTVVNLFSLIFSPFSFDWWGWMFCTGYFLACTFRYDCFSCSYHFSIVFILEMRPFTVNSNCNSSFLL